MAKLVTEEREVIITATDDEDAWHVFTDSRRFKGRLLQLARRWGTTPEPTGGGVSFRLPLAALRFVGPRQLSDKQRQHLSRMNSRKPSMAS